MDGLRRPSLPAPPGRLSQRCAEARAGPVSFGFWCVHGPASREQGAAVGAAVSSIFVRRQPEGHGPPGPLEGPGRHLPEARSGPMLDGRNKTPRRGEGSLARDQRHARRRGPTYRAGHARDDLDCPGNVMPTDVVAIAAGRDRAHDLGAAGEDRCCAPSRPAAGRPVLRTPRPLRHRGRVLCARRRALGTGRWPIGVGASAGGGRAQNSVRRAARSMMELTASDIAAALIRIPAPGRAAERGPFSMIPGLGPPPRRPGEPRSMSGITG